MRNPFRNSLIIVFTVIAFMPAAYASEQLVNQLRGKGEAAARTEEQLLQDYRTAVDYLLPLMSAEDVQSRYRYQIDLQDMASFASRPGAVAECRALAAALAQTLEQKQMPAEVQNWLLLQLQQTDPGTAVNVLTKFMASNDKIQQDYARRALELSPNPAATDVLLKELDKAQDAVSKMGLISSLGQRRAETAVPSLAKALRDPDGEVINAAASALSKIGKPQAVQTLKDALNQSANEAQIGIGYALLESAHAMLRQKDYAAASSCFEDVAKWAKQAPNAGSLRAAALAGLFECRPPAQVEQIAMMIKDEDPIVRRAAAHAVRNAAGTEPLAMVCGMLKDLDSDDQIRVMAAVADRGDLSFIKYVSPMLGSGDAAVQIQAVSTLASLGSDVSAGLLLSAAASGSADVSRAATKALALITGPGVEESIKQAAQSGDEKSRVIAIGLLAEHRYADSSPILFACARQGSEEIKKTAFKAMTDLLEPADIPAFIELLAANPAGASFKNGIAALKSAMARSDDKEAAAASVIAQIDKTSDVQARAALLGTLSSAGGPTALKVVSQAAASADEAISDAGIRTLCGWPDYEAAAMLLEIAANPKTSLIHHALAINGIARLVKDSASVSVDQRISLCIKALEIVRRTDEKKGIISALGTLPDEKAADKLLLLAGDPDLKSESAMALLDLAGRMRGADKAFSREVAQKVRKMEISQTINRQADKVAAD